MCRGLSLIWNRIQLTYMDQRIYTVHSRHSGVFEYFIQVCSRNHLAFALLVEFEITLKKILASLHYFYANFISNEHFSNRNNVYSLPMV